MLRVRNQFMFAASAAIATIALSATCACAATLSYSTKGSFGAFIPTSSSMTSVMLGGLTLTYTPMMTQNADYNPSATGTTISGLLFGSFSLSGMNTSQSPATTVFNLDIVQTSPAGTVSPTLGGAFSGLLTLTQSQSTGSADITFTPASTTATGTNPSITYTLVSPSNVPGFIAGSAFALGTGNGTPVAPLPPAAFAGLILMSGLGVVRRMRRKDNVLA